MSANPFQPFLDLRGFALLDGGLATTLQAGGHDLATELWSARLLLDAPHAIRAAHERFLEAGADCITTASYQASVEGFAKAGLSAQEAERLLRLSVALAIEARTSHGAATPTVDAGPTPLVAASAGPYGALLADGSEYDGRYGVGSSVLEGFHERRLDVISETEADLVAFETIPSAAEAAVIGGLLSARPDVAAWVSFSCRDEERLWDGTPVEEAALACSQSPGLVAIGVNCVPPEHVEPLVGRIVSVAAVPVAAYPNSGERYDPGAKAWEGASDPAAWGSAATGWLRAGARLLGGCCRVGPEYIRRLRVGLTGPDGP